MPGTPRRGQGPARALPTRTQAKAAAERICARRLRADDPDLFRLPDEDDLLGIVHYSRTRSRVPADVVAAEVPDVLQIIRYLRGLLDGEELGQIERGTASGLSLTALAGPLGYQTRQGVEARKMALLNAVRGEEEEQGPGLPRIRRRDGRRARLARRQTAGLQDWMIRNERRVRVTADRLLKHRQHFERSPDTSEWLDDLAERLLRECRTATDRKALIVLFRVTVQQIVDALRDDELTVQGDPRSALSAAERVAADSSAAERAAKRMK